MDCTCGNQEVIVFLHRPCLHILVNVERTTFVLRHLQLFDHMRWIYVFFETKIDHCTRLRVHHVIAFVLGIVNAKRIAYVFGCGMHL